MMARSWRAAARAFSAWRTTVTAFLRAGLSTILVFAPTEAPPASG